MRLIFSRLVVTGTATVVASVNAQYVERAPASPELYSRGAHDATATFEIGDPALKKERARTIEAGLRRSVGPFRFDATGYYTRYTGFIYKRDTGNQVIFCGIQSIWNKTVQLGPVDLVIVDEAHAISRNADTQYGKFFTGIKEVNPDSRVCGTTATDYRMDSGRLTEGDDRLFDDVVYEAKLSDLIEQVPNFQVERRDNGVFVKRIR